MGGSGLRRAFLFSFGWCNFLSKTPVCSLFAISIINCYLPPLTLTTAMKCRDGGHKSNRSDAFVAARYAAVRPDADRWLRARYAAAALLLPAYLQIASHAPLA